MRGERDPGSSVLSAQTAWKRDLGSPVLWAAAALWHLGGSPGVESSSWKEEIKPFASIGRFRFLWPSMEITRD
jgi:hypothetical protein